MQEHLISQLSLMLAQLREAESRETLRKHRMGMPIDWAIEAMRAGEALPVVKEAGRRANTSEAVRRRALMTLISRMAAGEAAHD